MALAEALERIKEIVADVGSPDEVDSIELDDISFGTIPAELKKELEKYKNLNTLSLNNCGLENLDNMPHLADLVELHLEENPFKGSALKGLSHLTNLKLLNLMRSKIADASDLSALSNLQLDQIELDESPITEKEDYRKKVFATIKSLRIVDNEDADGNPPSEGEGGEDGEGASDFEGEDDDEDGEDEEDDEEEDDAPKKKKK